MGRPLLVPAWFRDVLEKAAQQLSLFDEQAHPRHGKGSAEGGRFAPKGGEKQGGGSDLRATAKRMGDASRKMAAKRRQPPDANASALMQRVGDVLSAAGMSPRVKQGDNGYTVHAPGQLVGAAEDRVSVLWHPGGQLSVESGGSVSGRYGLAGERAAGQGEVMRALRAAGMDVRVGIWGLEVAPGDEQLAGGEAGNEASASSAPEAGREGRARRIEELQAEEAALHQQIREEVSALRPMGQASVLGIFGGPSMSSGGKVRGVTVSTPVGDLVFAKERAPSKEQLARWNSAQERMADLRREESRMTFGASETPETTAGNVEYARGARRLADEGWLTAEEIAHVGKLERFWEDNPDARSGVWQADGTLKPERHQQAAADWTEADGGYKNRHGLVVRPGSRVRVEDLYSGMSKIVRVTELLPHGKIAYLTTKELPGGGYETEGRTAMRHVNSVTEIVEDAAPVRKSLIVAFVGGGARG